MRDQESTFGAPSEELIRLRQALEVVGEGFQVIGKDWRYLYLNAAAARQGHRDRDQFLGRTMMECFPGIEDTDMFRTLERCMSESVPAAIENEFTYPDGSKGWFELRVQPCPQGLSIFSVDITERKRLEAQLRHAQKMEAVGRLAGGVAHDFNNLLTVILACGSMAQSSLPGDAPARRDVDEMIKAGNRAAALTRQLLTLSRRRVGETRHIDLNDLLKGMEPMLRPILGSDVTYTFSIRTPLGSIRADPALVEQVILNLAVNARDAMPGGGRLTIETADVVLDEAYASRHFDARPGPHAMVAVSDTGTGMDRATQERIFEPFFTTKEPGKGTGLGLSIVYGVVKQAGGSVWVYSEPGHGTTFKLYFPHAAALEPSAAPKPMELPAAGGAETVLLCEDDEQVRTLTRAILSRNGYHVVATAAPAEALSAACGDEPIHLLLTDIVLPAMRGPQLAARLAERHSELRVLYMSGYAETAAVGHGAIDVNADLLQKPFTPDALLRKVREVLDRAPASAS